MKTHRDRWLAARELVAREARYLTNLPHAHEFGEFQSSEFEDTLWNHILEALGSCICCRDASCFEDRNSEIAKWCDDHELEDLEMKDFADCIEVAIDELFESWE